MDWGTVASIALGAAVSLVSTLALRRWEWCREQRVRIRLNELRAVRNEIDRLKIGADDPVVDPAHAIPRKAEALYSVASITSKSDRDHGTDIVAEANTIKAVGDRYDWHGDPQPTIEERRVHGPEQQLAVHRLDEKASAYEQWLEDRLRFDGWRSALGLATDGRK